MHGMVMKKRQIESEILSLLRVWGDALLERQLINPRQPETDGGIFCPACGRIHGRCHEAVYPLLALARRTGDYAYFRAAVRLFDWGENVLCKDGAMQNDPGAAWKGTTAFGAIALHDALRFYGDLLSEPQFSAWDRRLRGMGEWLFRNLTVGAPAYINYYAANACAMALLGVRYKNRDYLSLARELAEYCFQHISEEGLLCGEGRPHSARTEKGCAPVDICYNAEESLPCLLRYAETAEDDAATEQIKKLYYAILPWMLPDGAWDDSFGTRAFKWSYWGSRTADGCQDAFFRMGKMDPVFAEAALRNLALYRRCTANGLLTGGPDYALHGEKICVHHTFCRMKTLAASLDAGLYDVERCPLPSEFPAQRAWYPSLDTARLTGDGWIADITAYDFPYKPGSHVSGGALSLLRHKEAGPVIACGMAEYALLEPMNQQTPSFPASHRSPCPRIEAYYDGMAYANIHDSSAVIKLHEGNSAQSVIAKAFLRDAAQTPYPGPGGCTLTYTLSDAGFLIEGGVSPEIGAQFVLPVISRAVSVTPQLGALLAQTEGFCLNPGFCFREYRIAPDENGRFAVLISIIR